MQHTVILFISFVKFISGQICISGELKAAVVAYNWSNNAAFADNKASKLLSLPFNRTKANGP